MAIINYKDIDFKKSINTDNKIIDFNGLEIRVIPYLPVNEKYQLVMATLAKANDNGIFNPVLKNMHFYLNIVYMYTSILFSAEDRANEEDLYDNLLRSGLLTLIIQAIDPAELDALNKYLECTEQAIVAYNSGVAGLVDKVLKALEGLPEKFDKALEILKDFNPEMFKDLINNKNNNSGLN